MFNKKSILLFLLSLIILTALNSRFSQSFDMPENKLWMSDKDMQVYFQAINEIKNNALIKLTLHEIISGTLKAYLKIVDPFSGYLDSKEYADFKRLQRSNYAGIGMEIEKNPSGEIICFPYPEGSADKSGIKAGDILESVDGIEVSEKSVFSVGAMVRGEAGKSLVLKIFRNGLPKEIKIKREVIISKSVITEYYDKTPVIKILFFTNSTQRELKSAIIGLNYKLPIVFDLRGNPGGDLHSAMDCAMLFLDKDKIITGIRTLEDVKVYKSTTQPVNSDSVIYLWQDEYTASAAEVFIAALVKNNRAESIGKQTFGKGITQKIIELMDGSAIFLTNGYLQMPDGETYNKQGLKPTYSLEVTAPKTEDFLSKVEYLKKHNYKF